MTLNPNAKMEETQKGTEVYNVDPLIVKSHYRSIISTAMHRIQNFSGHWERRK